MARPARTVKPRAKPKAAAKPARVKPAPAKPAPVKPAAAYPEQAFATPAAWSSWLAKHHAMSPGIAMRIGRKGGAPSVTYAEALEIALAWGWIDGQKAKGDDTAWIQRWSPRKPRSIWSKINRDKALAMIERGEMQPPGLAAIAQAKLTGQWHAAYDSPKVAGVPADLAAALAADPRAEATFAGLDANNRYAILHRLQTAKLPATRARRLETFVAMLGRGETLHPPRRATGRR